MRKIERKICALCVMLLLLCSLCGCAGRKPYTEAMQLLGLIEVETEEGETIPAKAAVEDEVYTMDADTLEAAIELLERAGKYRNAAAVLAHARQNLAYVRAVESFQRGDFSVAESAFLELEPGFAQSEKYQLAITMLSRASGTWTASVSGSPDYSEYYEDQMLSGTVTCTIAAPYSIGESEYSDCDWVANANISVQASYSVLGGEGYRKHSIGTKSVNKQKMTGFHHVTDTMGELNPMILIKNEEYKDFLFTPLRGAYSMISMEYDAEADTITLTEVPYDMNWATSYPSEVTVVTLRREAEA